MKRMLDCQGSDFRAMGREALLGAIAGAEGRTIACETICSIQPMLGDITNAEFVAAMGADILLLNMQGEVPSDWNYSGSSNITTPLQYFNLKGKDYIVTADGEKAIILNRRGENRVTPKGNTKGIETELFADILGSQDRFIAAGENGKILFIYTNNQVQESEIKKFEKDFDFTVYKGRMGNYYMFYDKNGFEAYDKDMKIYLRDIQNYLQ